MKPVVEIGLPELDEEQLDLLAENCEQEITNFILKTIPAKSVEDLTIVCEFEITTQLDTSIEIDLAQQYDTGHDLDELVEKATQFGYEWLEGQLRELKQN
ncbi:MAG: DUF3194 domain-containing protein [Candidatus Thorarchaeota archaeon]|jgi:hypothetical protein